MNGTKKNIKLLILLLYPAFILSQDSDYLLEEIRSLRAELRSQEAQTQDISAKLNQALTEQSQIKTDMTNLNFKTVSLYNSVSEGLDFLSDDLQELKKNVRDEFSQTNNQIKQISKTLENEDKSNTNLMEVESLQEINSTISTLQEKLHQQKEDMVEIHDNIFSSIRGVKDLLNSGVYALTSDLSRTQNDVNTNRQSYRDLESTMKKSLSSLDKFTANSETLQNTNHKFERFRLEMIQQIAILKYEENSWIEFQRRGQYGNQPDYFKRTFRQYENGFGDPYKEFWIGLKKLHQLTSSGQTSLRVEVTDWKNRTFVGEWSNFRVGNGPAYTLGVHGYKGNIGDSLRISNGMHFSAMDKDMDRSEGECSVDHRGGGGWWFNACGLENLNGENLGPREQSYSGILWFLQKNSEISFKSSVMKIRKH